MSTDYVINNDKLNCVKFNINVKQHTEMSSGQYFYFKPEKKESTNRSLQAYSCQNCQNCRFSQKFKVSNYRSHQIETIDS
jgi:hypothetical protein